MPQLYSYHPKLSTPTKKPLIALIPQLNQPQLPYQQIIIPKHTAKPLITNRTNNHHTHISITSITPATPNSQHCPRTLRPTTQSTNSLLPTYHHTSTHITKNSPLNNKTYCRHLTNQSSPNTSWHRSPHTYHTKSQHPNKTSPITLITQLNQLLHSRQHIAIPYRLKISHHPTHKTHH